MFGRGESEALHGCIPILVTPFADDGSLDLESLEREIDWVLAEGASGVACVAIASEGYKLTESERDAVIATTVGKVGGRVPVVASADGPGEEPAIDRARRAAALGADVLMVLPSYFVKPGPDAIASYYARIAEASAGLRYIKAEGTPQGPTISEALRLCGDRIGVFCGWGGLSLLDALERGAIGNMPAPNFTRFFADVQRVWETGDRKHAEQLFDRGVPFVMWSMQSIDHSVTAAKVELHRRGVIASPRLRQPALALDEIACDQLSRFIERRFTESQ